MGYFEELTRNAMVCVGLISPQNGLVHLCGNVDVVVISPTTYFNFTPLLASTSVGTLEFRTAIEPVSLVHLFLDI